MYRSDFSIFFFSSRRRHTRSLRDWSSDVCSSDLPPFFVQSSLEARPCRSSDYQTKSGSLNHQTLASLLSPRTYGDRKSTRLNSSHVEISYAVFCLKKKKK